jgi:hypothetical protein
MTGSLTGFVASMPALAERARSAGVLLSGEIAAHAHLAVASGSQPGAPPRYAALVPRRIAVIASDPATTMSGAEAETGALAEVLRHRLDLYRTTVRLGHTELPVLTKEAVVAQLLSQGGLAIGLVAALLRVACDPPLDVDVVRELLKAARQGERYQPLLELLDVA